MYYNALCCNNGSLKIPVINVAICQRLLLISMLLANAVLGRAQYLTDTIYPIRYVDFHLHTTMKNYYRNTFNYQDIYNPTKAAYLSTANWKNLGKPRKITDRLGFSGVNGKASYDQATFSLLNQGNASIVCTSIYALEKQSIAANKFVLIFSMAMLNKMAVTHITLKRQRQARKCTGFDEFKSQVKFLDDQQLTFPGYSKAVKIADYPEQLKDTSVIWQVITAEGIHNFYGQREMKDWQFRVATCNDASTNEIIHNIQDAKNMHRLLFVTPSHLFWGKVAGHARGLDSDNKLFRNLLAKLMWSKNFAVVDGKPAEGIINKVYGKYKGPKPVCDCLHGPPLDIPTAGWKFIFALLDTANNFHKRTLIDLRHMDIKARHDYITFVKDRMEKDKDTIPIIISHAAVSGKSYKMASYLGLCPVYDNYEEFIDPRKYYIKQFGFGKCAAQKMGIDIGTLDDYLKVAGWFHPMSNNLYDEEIADVYASKGIIGISMEERVLGKGTYNYTHQPDPVVNYLCSHPEKTARYKDQPGGEEKFINDMVLAEPFVRNLFYIVQHSGMLDKPGLAAWKHVAIGSDFDGIMNPIDICPTAADIPAFYSFLVRNLQLYAESLGKHDLLLNQTPETLLKLVFYQNGEDFIKRNL